MDLCASAWLIVLSRIQNSQTVRRLASEHAALHDQLPQNYLFPPNAVAENLTQLDVLLAGPTHTPFAAGLWKLHLNIPPTYPTDPPTAHFRTPIFHPNVDPQTGSVCVETLKRDWDARYSLAHVLQTISCLLIEPNPDSALNAEAGQLLREDYEVFARRAALMTGLNATVPRGMQAAVEEAQRRGAEEEAAAQEPPARRRRTIAQARARAAAAAGRSPPAAPNRRTYVPPAQLQPFVFQAGEDDVFGQTTTPPSRREVDESSKSVVDDEDENMTDADQENESHRSPYKSSPPPLPTPRRPHGAAVPLGELIMEDDSDSNSEEMEPEYPPSPRKSPSKSPAKRRNNHNNFNSSLTVERAESSRDAVWRGRNITPLNAIDKPLAEDSPFSPSAAVTFSPSPRKMRTNLFETPGSAAQQVSRSLFGKMTAAAVDDSEMSIFGPRREVFSSSIENAAEVERSKRSAEDARLWELCGGDIKRWNRGDFDGQPFKVKASRW